MYEKVEKCPVCKGKEFKNFIICQDHLVSDESFVLTNCSSCGLLLTNPRPDQESIGNYYKSEDYISHTSNANNLTNLLYKLVRTFTLNKKLKLINKYASNKTLLDYGCGTGEFISHCKKNDWHTIGIEPDENARSRAIQLSQSEVYETLGNIEKEENFSIITLWHVLEHIHDVNKTLKEILNRLDNNGHLIVALPNHNSYDAKYYADKWAGYDVPRHVYHFNQLTIKELAKKHKLKIIDTIPMIFDAYYVSLLSEKYLKGKNNFFKAFMNGWKSNQWAKKNDMNYSSLIYVMKRK